MENTAAASTAVNEAVEGEVEIIVGSDDWTGITATRARTAIRGGGIGARAYVAKLSAPSADSRYEFEREFMDADRSDVSRSGRSGGITWELDGEGIYEFARFAASSRYPVSGYVRVLPGGLVEKIGKREIKKLLGI